MAPKEPQEPGAGRVAVTVMVAPHDLALVQSVALRQLPTGQGQSLPSEVMATDVS
jgi:hypothetical protein